MTPKTTLTITDAQAGRIDRALALAFPAVGRRRLAELFAQGAVRVGGRVARKGDRVGAGAVVELASVPVGRAEERPVPDEAAAARLQILLERPELVAVCKPAPMPSQPLRAGELGSVASGLAFLYPECAALGDDPRDGGVAHRLDIGTTGVLLAARTAAMFRALREAFSAGQVDKRYLAITCGRPLASSCSASLSQRGRRVVVDEQEGLGAHTDVEVLATSGGLSLVRCAAQTGRMHQVRAHLAVLRAPILGDALYGAPEVSTLERGAALAAALPAGRFVLHAESVGLRLGREALTVTAPLPPETLAVLAAAELPPPG
ncbi:MAG: RluA family pseudouridine synthase [Kofleriaceae bacterium]